MGASGWWEVLLGPCCLRGACPLPTLSLSNQAFRLAETSE